MSAEDESWIFDSLVNYLVGPVWNLPICNFIENKSIVFENDRAKDDEFRHVYDDYKNLVDFMLQTYMEDLQINSEQFSTACSEASKQIRNSPVKSKFEQVWAADDFEMFRRMMIEKNLDLQLQVLDMLQRQHGIIPASFVSDGTMPPDEEEVMREVIKKSLLEYEVAKHQPDNEESGLKEVIEQSNDEKERIILERESLIKDQTPPKMTPSNEIDADDLKRRQEHFREQRDKLLALKREEREKQLEKYEKSTTQSRPKSSRAARKVLSGASIEPQTLQLRRTLVERLKNEVIGE